MTWRLRRERLVKLFRTWEQMRTFEEALLGRIRAQTVDIRDSLAADRPKGNA